MGFEVVGLPHYVIWHVYEPSEDDLIRMKQMDEEKEAREQDVEDIGLSRARWDMDRKVVESIMEEKKAQKVLDEPGPGSKAVMGGAEGPVAHVGDEGVPTDHGNGLTGIEQVKVEGEEEESKDDE
jgi:hypothetical protein